VLKANRKQNEQGAKAPSVKRELSKCISNPAEHAKGKKNKTELPSNKSVGEKREECEQGKIALTFRPYISVLPGRNRVSVD
jgi:hypothetical protein